MRILTETQASLLTIRKKRVLQFKSGKYTVYAYTYESAGADAVETMKSLARQGHGLNSYISKNQPGYSEKR